MPPDRHPGFVSVTTDGVHALYSLDEWLSGPASPPDAVVRYHPTLRAMTAWSDRVGYRIAPKPKPDEAQIARIAEMLTRND